MNFWLKVAKQKALSLLLVSFILFGFTACSQKAFNTNYATAPAKAPAAPALNPFYQFELKQSFGNGIVEAADWASDNSSFALATSLKVDLYSTESLQIIATLETGQWNKKIAYSPDSKLLAIGGDDGAIQIWDIQLKERVHTFSTTGPQAAYGNGVSFAFSKDGKKLVSAYYQTVYLWDLSTGKLIESFPGYMEAIDSVAISPDEKTIIAGGSRKLFVQDVKSGELLYPAIEFIDDLVSVYFAQDGNQFYTVHNRYQTSSNSTDFTYESAVKTWKFTTGEKLAEHSIRKARITVSDVNQNANTLILGGENMFQVWDYSSQKVITSSAVHAGWLKSIAVSPDGNKFITVGGDFADGNGLIQLWDMQTKQVVTSFDGYNSQPTAVAFSPNERYVAIAGGNNKTQLLDLTSGQVLHVFNGGQPVTFSPDSKIIAYAESPDHLALADVDSGKLLPFPTIYCPRLTVVAFQPGADAFAVGGESCDLQIYSSNTGKLIKNLSQVQENAYLSFETIGFSPDGKKMILSGYRFAVLDAETGKKLIEEESQRAWKSAVFSPDGRYMAVDGFGTYSDSEMIQLREADSNQTVVTIKTQQDSIHQMMFGPDGHTLLVVGGNVELWDVWQEKPLATANISNDSIVGTALMKDGKNLFIVDERAILEHWSFQPDPQMAFSAQPTPTLIPTLTATPNIPKIQLVQVGEIGKGKGSRVSYSLDGMLAAFVQNSTLKWFDTRSRKLLGSVEMGDDVGSVIISPNNKFAVVDSYSGHVVNLETQQVIGNLSGGNGSAFGFTFSKDSQYIAYTMGDQTTGGPYHNIAVWSTAKADFVPAGYDNFQTLLPDRYHRMSPPAISPNSKWVAAGHSDKRVYVWDLQTGETRLTLEGHAAEVTCVDFNPNGGLLASGSKDGTIRFWDPATGKLVRILTGFVDDIWGIQFTSNGQSLKVRLGNEQTYLADLSSGKITLPDETKQTLDPFELQQYEDGYSTSDSSIFSEVLFSPDRKTLATGSENVLLWDVANERLLKFLNNPSGTILRGTAFNADGSALAATTNDNQVLVWDTATGKLTFVQPSDFLPGDSVIAATGDTQWGPARSSSILAEQGLAFSPERNLLAFGNDHAIEIWNVNTAEKVGELINPAGYYATQVSYSADGKHLYAILNRNRIAQIWDVTTGKLIRQIDLPDEDANAYSAVALKGPLFARNNTDGKGVARIEIWDLEHESSVNIPAESASNEPLVFSPDGSLLIAFGRERTLNVWNTSTGQLVYQTQLDFYAGGLSISPDNKYLAIGNSGKATIFDFEPIVQLRRQPNQQQVSTPQATPTPRVLAWPTTTPLPTSAKPSDATNSLIIDSKNASQVKEKNCFGNGKIEQVVWSQDGSSILLTGAFGVSEYKIDAQAGKFPPLWNNDPGSWSYDSVRLPDGRILSTTAQSGNVSLWDMSSAKQLANINGGGQPAISPDGSLLAYVNSDGALQVWDVATKKIVNTLQSYSHYSASPIFSPNGKWIAALQIMGSRYDDSIRLWDAHTGEIVNALGGPDNDITDFSFSDDGQFMVGAAGGSAWIWDLHSDKEPQKLELYPVELNGNLNLYTNTATAVTLSPDNNILAVGTSEHTLKLYDRSTMTLLRELRGHTATLRHLRFSPDGQLLVSIDQDGIVILWDAQPGKRLATLSDYSNPTKGSVFDKNGNLLAWGEGNVWTLDIPTLNILHTTHVESGAILAASPADDVLAVYQPFSVSLYDAQSGKVIQKLEGEAEEPWVEYYWEGLALRKFYAASFSQDGSRLATAGAGGVWYYDTAKRHLLQQYPGSNAQKITLNPSGQLMLTSLYDQANPVSVFDTQTGNMLFSLAESGNFIQSVFSPDGRWVATLQASWDGPTQLKIFDTLSQKEYKSLSLDAETPLTSVTFNPSDDLIAVGKANGQILLISINDMKIISTLTAHRGAVEHLLFSLDGKYLMTSGADGTLRTWGLP